MRDRVLVQTFELSRVAELAHSVNLSGKMNEV